MQDLRDGSDSVVRAIVALLAGDDLERAPTHLMDALDLIRNNVAVAVYETINYEGEQTVTFEQIGARVTFVNRARLVLKWMSKELGQIEKAILDDLDEIRINGRHPHIPSFTRTGTPNYNRAPDALTVA
jgi:hypothetical protein